MIILHFSCAIAAEILSSVIGGVTTLSNCSACAGNAFNTTDVYKRQTQHLLNDAIDAWSPEEMSKTAILQVNSCYLVWEHRKNIYIADQHAVHERILYEQIKLGFYEKVAKNLPFTYPQPQKLSLSLTDTSLLEEYSSSLKTMGFQFKRQGDIWYVTSVPSFLKNRTMSDVISEILYHVSSESCLLYTSRCV